MKTIAIAATFASALCLAPVAGAAEQAAHPEGDQSMSEAAPTAKLHGTVNSINAGAGRVNITHDPVESLKWPKMKMNFKAHDPALLKDVKPGMTVDFEIQKMGSEYYITQIAPAK